MESGNDAWNKFLVELEENIRNSKPRKLVVNIYGQKNWDMFDRACRMIYDKEYKNSIDLEDKSDGE